MLAWPLSLTAWSIRLELMAWPLTGEGGLLTGLIQQALQGALETEITDNLGYEPRAVDGRGSGNSRNRHYSKTVRTEVGDVGVRVPRTATAVSNRSRSRSGSVVCRVSIRW